jgi:hypothetical protein
MDTLDLCRATLQDLIGRHWLATYKHTGKFQPPGRDRAPVPKELAKLLWYARLDGPLYRDETRWRAAYRLVDSFRQGRSAKLGSSIRLDDVFGPIAAPLEDVHRFLSTAFASLDFKCRSNDAAAQTAQFSSEHSCKVEDLPEPYGKWLQIRRQKPAWDQPAQLRLRADCRLRASGPRACHLILTTSTFAPPLLDGLARQIGQFTREPSRPPEFSREFFDRRLAWMHEVRPDNGD